MGENIGSRSLMDGFMEYAESAIWKVFPGIQMTTMSSNSKPIDGNTKILFTAGGSSGILDVRTKSIYDAR